MLHRLVSIYTCENATFIDCLESHVTAHSTILALCFDIRENWYQSFALIGCVILYYVTDTVEAGRDFDKKASLKAFIGRFVIS